MLDPLPVQRCGLLGDGRGAFVRRRLATVQDLSSAIAARRIPAGLPERDGSVPTGLCRAPVRARSKLPERRQLGRVLLYSPLHSADDATIPMGSSGLATTG
jgi:hypothetical protein